MAPTLYSIGDPTDDEQLYLEFINRARANPSIEGQLLASTTDTEVLSAYDYFNVDLTMLVNEFNALAAAAPLSFNAALLRAARLHSGDMFTNQFQGHYGSTPATSNLVARVQAQGYAYSYLGENVYSYTEYPFHGHAGFEVDWGPGPGGMQGPPRGHRENIHSRNFREVGVGVVNGRNGSVGPQLVTQDFGSRNGMTPLVTGVVYYDVDGDGAYDAGEGVGGVRVTVHGVDYFAVSAGSGGYSVPVPGNGTYQVTFDATNGAPVVQSVTVSGGQNRKLDHGPAYPAPALSGPSLAGMGETVRLSFTPVAGASLHEWRQTLLVPYLLSEGAENGMPTTFQAVTSPGYTVVSSGDHNSGQYAFHLAMPDPESQRIDMSLDLRIGTDGQLLFASRLGWASSKQVARVLMTTDGGRSWQELWSHAGTGNAGQGSFEDVSVSLAAYTGRIARFRFLYDFSSGSYYPQTDSSAGWWIDDIRFTGVEELRGSVSMSTTATTLDLVPTQTGTYQLEVRPQVAGRWFPYGPSKLLTVDASPPLTAALLAFQVAGGGQLRFDCAVQNGPPANIQLESRPDLATSWQPEAGATSEVVEPGSLYRFTVPVSGVSQRYYRVRLDR